jgi:hypothetical protein
MLQQVIDNLYDVVQNCWISGGQSPMIQNSSENKSLCGTFLQTKILNKSLRGGDVALF